MNIITTVKYDGRLHLGYGAEDAIGNRLGTGISIYNNPIAKFFTKMLGTSVDIEINGKVRCLNKSDFIKHLKSIDNSIAYNQPYSREGFYSQTFASRLYKIKEIGYNRFIQDNEKDIKDIKIKLSENIPHQKRMELTLKLARNMFCDNTEIVKKTILKGAYVDRKFHQINREKETDIFIDANEFKGALNKYPTPPPFKSHTPLAYAAERGNRPLCQLITNITGDIHLRNNWS